MVTLGRARGRVAIVIAVAVLAGLAAWLLIRHYDNSGSGSDGSSSPVTGTADVSARTLRALSASLGRPVFWAGARQDVTYEFTETADRRVYVRYLPRGVAAGSSNPYLTVASYHVADAFAVTKSAAAGPDMVKLAVPGGGVAFYSKTRPTNAYVAFPGKQVQIEVYDPDAGTMHRLVSAGEITAVSSSGAAAAAPVVRTQAVKASSSALRKLAAQLGRPIYWLGALPGRALELTHAPDGRVYLRYLPPGVQPGSPKALLAVATYPVVGGYQATLTGAKAAGVVSIPLPNGAVAFYSKTRPTNVYVAFPGIDEQVEVYDPSAQYVHRLVRAAKVAAVR